MTSDTWMTDETATVPATPVPDRQASRAADADAAHAGEQLVEAELLVEEVSIDGMCGVY